MADWFCAKDKGKSRNRINEQEPEGNLQTQKQADWDLNTQNRAV